MVAPRSDTPSSTVLAEDPAGVIQPDIVTSPWLRSPSTDQSIDSFPSEAGPVRRSPSRVHSLNRSSSPVDLSKWSRVEFLRRRGVWVDRCDESSNKSRSSASSSAKTSPGTSEAFDSGVGVLAILGKSQESPRCELVGLGGWGDCSCGGRGGHHPEEVAFARSCRDAASL